MNRFFMGVIGVMGCCAVLTACGGTETGTVETGGTGSSGGTGSAGGTGGSAGGSTSVSTGGSTSGSTGGGTGGLTKEQACDTFSGPWCARLEDCAPFLFAFNYDSVATCTERSKLSCLAQFDLDGTTVTPDKRVACDTALIALSCDQLVSSLFDGGPSIAACDSKGTRDAGAACASGAQCKDETCMIASKENCGTCVKLPVEGEPCGATKSCAAGLYCNVSIVCAKLPAKGEPCAQPYSWCSGNLGCIGGTCETKFAAGAACADSECDLEVGLTCDPSSKTCTPLVLAKVGEACDFNGAFCEGLKPCDQVTKKCVEDIADGAACTAGNDLSCLPAARCIDSKCSVAPPVCN